MASLLLSSLVAFVLCLILTPLVRACSLRLGGMDRPDARRKLHARATPRVGGIAVAISYVAAFGLLPLVHFDPGVKLDASILLAWKVFPAAGVIFAVGLVDDLVGLRPWHKLSAQVLAAGITCWTGIRIDSIAGWPTGSWLGILLTILWLVGCTNAFNLIDGMDGLASGIGFFATVTTLIAALLQHNMDLALTAAPLAGCLLAFLRYNFNPASIFLGDSGSLFIGFLLGCYGIIWSQKSATLLGMTAPLMAFSIPLLDTILAIARRFIRRKPIFGADSDHIHHRLLRRGVTTRNVAALIYLLSGLAAGFSLLQSMIHDSYAGLVIVLFCVAAWIGVHHLGYIEFGAVRRVLLGGGIRTVLQSAVCVDVLAEALSRSRNYDDCWQAIVDASRVFGFGRVVLSIGGRKYEERLGRAPRENCWSLRVPLSPSDYIEFEREFYSQERALPTAPFVDVVRRSFQLRFRDFGPKVHLLDASRAQQPVVTYESEASGRN
jgi:UDP-GlcNAc:undecaprenyl-phosphate GlcNAc-1-phosphate transferase